MSAEEPTPAPARRRSKRAAKKSLWQTDLSSIGKKDAESVADEEVERPPFQPSLPQVDLLPQSVRDSMAIARVRNWAIGGLAVVALLAGGLWWLQGSTIAQAEDEVRVATAENAKLKKDLAALAPVKQMYDQITKLQEIVTTTMASQPQAAVVIDRLATAAAGTPGAPIAFTNVDVSYTGIPQPGSALNACPNPDPFGQDITIGCLTFSANATDRAQVSALLRALEADTLFIGPYVTSTTATEQTAGPNGNKTQSVVNFSGTAGVSLEALKTVLTPEQVEALLNPPKPEPSPSASPSEGG